MSDITNTLKNLLVYVPSASVNAFISSHIGDSKENDDYYNRISFLSNGQIASHGMTFGLSTANISKLGVESLPNGQSSIVSYLVELGGKYDVLNGTLDTSVQAYVGQAVSSLINGAPAAYDTLGEIAALLAGDANLSSFADLQAQVGSRAKVNDEQGNVIDFPGNLYDYASYITNFEIGNLDVSDSAVAGQYVSAVSETDGKITVSRTALPSREDTAVTGQYVSQVTQTNGQITVTRASLPTYSDTAVTGQYVSQVTQTNGKIAVTRAALPSLSVDSTAGSSGQYISALSVSGQTITATYTSLPSANYAAVTGKYVASITQSEGLVSATFESFPEITIASSSTNFLSVDSSDKHKIGANVSSISTVTGFEHNANPQSGETTYSVKTQESIGSGLATASNIYNRIYADEIFVSSALSTLDDKINTAVSNSASLLDSTITITDDASYISATIVEQDGKLTTTGSSITFTYEKIYQQLNSTTNATATENNVTYGSMSLAITNGKISSSSLTINRENILAETSTTLTSGTTDDPIQVSVTEENHKITNVSVIFNDLSTLWQVYGS